MHYSPRTKGKGLSEGKPNIVLQNKANDADCGTAQRVRVTRPSRRSRSQRTRPRCRSSRRARRRRCRVRRACVVGAQGLVVVCDCGCDRWIFTVMQCVIAPHDPLQLGESPTIPVKGRPWRAKRRDATLRVLRPGTWSLKNRQPLHALTFSNRCRASRGRCGLSVPGRAPRAEPSGPRSRKNPRPTRRARRTRSLPATIAFPHPAGTVVGDEQEMRRRPVVELNTGKIFLLRAHRCCQHLGRQAHEIEIDLRPTARPETLLGR